MSLARPRVTCALSGFSPFQGEAGEQRRYWFWRTNFALEQSEHDRGNKGKRDIGGDDAQPVDECHWENLPV